MSKKHLLFVDDDRFLLATLAKNLRNAGYEVETADNGQAALQLGAQNHYDLAIVDIHMPHMNGTELAKHLRQRNQIPTLFLSAYSDHHLIEHAVKEGGVGYIVKPVDAQQLIPAIETALARARELTALLENKKHLEQALSGGRYTSMAIGILMERRRITQEVAFETLRNNARKQRIKLEEFSREIVVASNHLNF